jgi:glycosyltransferase involved in cell wall biosynthesis
MKILRCIRSLDPSLGGPVELLRQACLTLPELGHSAEVVCLDAPEAPWVHSFPAKVHALGPAKGLYGFSRQYVGWMRDHAEEYGAIIIDGLWQFPGWGSWLALRKSPIPYFVYTHGMLDPYFRRRHPLKHLKKWVYWMLAEYWVLREARAVLYTCEQEKRRARRSFWPYQVTEVVAVPGIRAPAGDSHHQSRLFLTRFPDLQGKRLILFVGRLHPIKGCDLLVEALASVCHVDPLLHLVFVGPDQTGLRQGLERRAAELGLGGRVTCTGALAGEVKWGAYRAAEVLMLPSHSENFGVVVVEAMACGVPVLISDKVNIWREVEATCGGLVASDDLDGTTALLQRWLTLPKDEREIMRGKAQKGFAENFSAQMALERLSSVLYEFSPRKASTGEQSS